jgi:peptidyl-prolyl cis-trans isomerase B (cyclophilin B)
MIKKPTYLATFGLLVVCLLVSGCTRAPASKTDDTGKNKNTVVSEEPNDPRAAEIKAKQATPKPTENMDLQGKKPIVTIEMEDGSRIKAELYPDTAPITVENFIYLVQRGFYDNLIFHRVIPKFMIQGGDPTGTGTGGPSYNIKGEFASNGVKNDLKHERGVLSMARSPQPDSAGSQFFIMVAAAPHLDSEYAAFGKVIEGMDTVDRIVSVKTINDEPFKAQRMKRVTVEMK